ncbi:MAG: DUF58 domain-containing protein [Verrucomicrobiota bacterium]
MLAEIDHRLNTLELKCRFPVEHLLAGEYHSVFKGRGIEFEDVRPYQAGDDVRSMEWKVTARTGTPHIKRYIEEREQFIYLIVDVSASILDDKDGLRRGTLSEVCALITMAAIKNNDRVGLILFSDQLEYVLPPGKGRQHALRIMEVLMTYQPQSRGTRFSVALDAVGHMARKRSIFFVVSDFLAEDHTDELSALSARHDVNAIYLLDKRYAIKNQHGFLRIQDAENRAEQIVDLNDSSHQSDAHQNDLRNDLLNHGVNLMELEVGEDCVNALNMFFRSRQRRIEDETGG